MFIPRSHRHGGDYCPRFPYLVLADTTEIVAPDEHRDDLPIILIVNLSLGAVLVEQLGDQRLGLARHSAVGRARLGDVQLRAVHVVAAVRVVTVISHLSVKPKCRFLFVLKS